MTRRTVLSAVLAVCALLGFASPTAAAQQASGPTLARADIAVTMNEGAEDVIRASYELTEPTAAATPIQLLVLPRDNAATTEITAVAGVTGVGPTKGIRADVTLPAGTSRYTVRQQVRRSAGEFGVPLAIPDIATDRTAKVTIEVALPPGARLTGDAMPSYSSAPADGERNLLRHRGQSLPSVLVAEYGSTTQASLGFWSSTVGIVLLGVVVLGWAYHSFRKDRVRR